MPRPPLPAALADFLQQNRIAEVECVIPDITGIARGKILPRDLFLSAGEMRLPTSPCNPPWGAPASPRQGGKVTRLMQ
jgi:hypothetical protein